ncbi:MAG: WbqC family protein [Defluviitaleaceae bacterium]|nr:WbqC family protein [Defluviitaleaceae bacterium]
MILSGHQPNYWPYAGLFGKIIMSDKFMYVADVQFDKKSWQNRNRIKTANGWTYITVPVLTKDKFDQKISDVEINNTTNWRDKHRKSIELNYKKSPYYNEYRDFIDDLYSKSWFSLCELDIYITNFILDELCVKKDILYDKDYEFTGAKTARLVNMCKQAKCDTYLSNKGSQEYVDIDCFIESGLNHRFVEYLGTEYKQQYHGFVSHLSVLDLLMNCGKDVTKDTLFDRGNYVFSEINKAIEEVK